MWYFVHFEAVYHPAVWNHVILLLLLFFCYCGFSIIIIIIIIIINIFIIPLSLQNFPQQL